MQKNGSPAKCDPMRKATRIDNVGVGLVLLPFAVGFSVFTFATFVAFPWQLDWPTIEGRVEEIKVRNKATATFLYRYRIDSKDYTGAQSMVDAFEHSIHGSRHFFGLFPR